jgi:hypothetical protein
MTPAYKRYHNYLAEHVITPFYESRLNNLKQLTLHAILKRKNPYLFKAKNIELAGELVRSVVDAYLSSQEETIFGNLLEGFAIFVSQTLHGGFKSALKSVDLEFEHDGAYYIVGIKSGTSWGNSDQVNKMRDNSNWRERFYVSEASRMRSSPSTDAFTARIACRSSRTKILRSNTTNSPGRNSGNSYPATISCIRKLSGRLIKKPAGRMTLSRRLTRPRLTTIRFTGDFMTGDNQIDWVKLVDYVSKREEKKVKKDSGKVSRLSKNSRRA